MSRIFSGFTSNTATKLLLDAGAFFKSFTVGTDTYESAKTAGKCIGATKGGGEFKAVPTLRKIEVDGANGAVKGLQVIDDWTVTLSATLVELSKESLALAIAAAKVTTPETGDYAEIEGKPNLEETDYTDNITWVGRLSGSETPVIIQIYNALNTNGLTLSVKDKNETTAQLVFTGHYTEEDLETPPFKVYYPKLAAGV